LRQSTDVLLDVNLPSFSKSGNTLQRACACGNHSGSGGECESCKKKCLGMQRAVSRVAPNAAPLIVHELLRSLGQPLEEGTRSFMESRFGQDFSRVPANSTFVPHPIQTKSKSSNAGDKYEQEAERVSREVSSVAVPRPLSHQHNHNELSESSKSRLTSKNGQTASAPFQALGIGSPLPEQARAFYELRFGYDFSNVRIHAGRTAASHANAFHAQAFTYGQHIVFNDGKFSPHTTQGKQLLAHELTHVVQQTTQAPTMHQAMEQGIAQPIQQSTDAPAIARLDASMCSSDCLAPDGTGPATGKLSITIYADKEGSFLLIPATHNVGHSWLRLEDDTGRFWTFGFWPQVGFDPRNASADVEGCVHHPDTAHRPTASQTFELTAAEFASAFTTATDICTTKPKYNLFGLQCTDFVKRVLTAAGKGSFGGFGLLWESPNALDTWIRTHSLVLGISTTAATSGTQGAGSVGLDITYRYQFYYLLGQKLRLYGLGRAEISQPVKSVSAGVGLELNPQRIYIPAPFIEGGGALGDISAQPGSNRFGAGVTGAAGLRFNIDEVGVVGIEYNLVKDLVNSDPALHRLMITAGIRIF
jgi:hypothetical protein